MRDFVRHLLLIVVPLVAAFAVAPAVYDNHLLLFNFVIFLVLAQGVNIILASPAICRSAMSASSAPAPTASPWW